MLDALEKAGALDHTLVVAISDNGFHLGDHGHFGKATLLEAATRVPLVITGPGVARPGVATTALAELVDVYPTLLDLCGLPPVAGLDGVSLRPVLQDPERSVKDAASSMLKIGAARSGTVGRTIRAARYRYTLWPDGVEELFDYWTDPDELVNLAPVASAGATRLALRRRIQELTAGRAGPGSLISAVEKAIRGPAGAVHQRRWLLPALGHPANAGAAAVARMLTTTTQVATAASVTARAQRPRERRGKRRSQRATAAHAATRNRTGITGRR